MNLTRNIPINPDDSALLFIDVQNFSAHRQGAEFADLSEAEFQEKYAWYFDELESHVIPKMKAIQFECRKAGVEVKIGRAHV